MSTVPYLTCHNLSISYGPTQLFKNLSFAVHPGERWGIVGPNGAGKSTLFKILTGQTTPDTGTVALRSAVRVSIVTQKFSVENTKSVEQILRESLAPEYDLDTKINSLEKETELHLETAEKSPDLYETDLWLSKLTQLQDSLADLSGAGTKNIIDSALHVAQLQHLANRPLNELSGGQQKRVQIVSALLSNPQLILLDEPTNHLDIQTVDWLEEFLLEVVEQGVGLLGFKPKDYVPEPFAFVIISHDRALLDTLVTKVFEIEAGESTQYEGNYEAYAEQKLTNTLSQKKAHARSANLFRRELAWLRAGTKARTTKQSARIERAHALQSDLKVKDKKLRVKTDSALDFEAQIVDEERGADDSFVPVLRTLGEQQLVSLKAASLHHPAYAKNPEGKEHFLFKNLNLVVKPRMRLAFLGPNGCGKSSLMQVLAGNEAVTSGEVQFHELTKISYFDQNRNNLDKSETIRKTIAPEGEFVFFGGKYIHIMSYLEKFLFSRFDAERTVIDLSGGEQARLLLAKMMLEHGNLLILDEPTNDLDIPTLQILERNLSQFQGGIIFTSHDRYFLQRVSTEILTYLGDKEDEKERVGQWMIYPDLDQALRSIDDFAQSLKKEEKSKKDQKGGSGSSQKKKISFQEQKELGSIEEKIETVENSMKAMTAKLDAAYASGSGYSETSKLAADIAQMQVEIKKLYARWEFLQEKNQG